MTFLEIYLVSHFMISCGLFFAVEWLSTNDPDHPRSFSLLSLQNKAMVIVIMSCYPLVIHAIWQQREKVMNVIKNHRSNK